MKFLKKLFNWPVTITMVIFTWCVFFAGFAIYSGNFKSDLVRIDYYEDKDIINKKTLQIKNSSLQAVNFIYDNQNQLLIFRFKDYFDDMEISGKFFFYRPSDQNLDHHLKIDLDEKGIQSVSTNELLPGFWRVNIEWEKGGLEFLQKEQLFIR